MQTIEIVDDFSKKHLDELHKLFQREWWSKNRTIRDIENLLLHSDIKFSVIDNSKDILVGFSRVLTDYYYFAFIFDVIIHPKYRGKGIGSKLLKTITGHPKLQKIHSFELCCQPEREEFYKRHGFEVATGRMRLKPPGSDF